MKKTEKVVENWVSQTDAAKILNKTLSGIGQMILRGRIKSKNIYGKVIVDTNSVTKGVAGRPKKPDAW